MRVEARRLAGAGRAGDQDVGHRRQVDQHGTAVDVATDRDFERMLGVARFARREDVAQRDDLTIGIGDLDTDRLLAGDRREDAHVGRGHRIGDVAIEARDTGDLDAGAELELVAGHRRADDHVDETGLHAVLGERTLELVAPFADTRPCRPRASPSV